MAICLCAVLALRHEDALPWVAAVKRKIGSTMTTGSSETTSPVVRRLNCGSCNRPIALDEVRAIVARAASGMLLPVRVCQQCRRLADVEEMLGSVLISDLSCHRCHSAMKLGASCLIENRAQNECSLICRACFDEILHEQHPLGYLAATIVCTYCRRDSGRKDCREIQCESPQKRRLSVWVCSDCFSKM